MQMHLKRYLLPEWPAPPHVRAVVTTRQCGNLALHVNDDPEQVAANRRRIHQELDLPAEPAWLEQVHGVKIINLEATDHQRTADAAYTRTQIPCAILTADCLPIFLTDPAGMQVAAVHAGWRGLAAGVIDAAVQAFTASSTVLVWLGPAIGGDHFEVGAEVREQFISRHADYSSGFSPLLNNKWLADIYHLARINFQHLGVTQIYGGGLCTVCDEHQFYSYRRDNGATGRMASLIWLTSHFF
jgi:polyphenol oxidase